MIKTKLYGTETMFFSYYKFNVKKHSLLNQILTFFSAMSISIFKICPVLVYIIHVTGQLHEKQAW